MKRLLFIVLCIIFIACESKLETPTEKRNYSQPATSGEVKDFAKKAAGISDYLSYEVFGKSYNDKDLFVVKASKPPVSENNKLRVLLFAQQHGNEQSGKEALMLLLRDIALGVHDDLLDNVVLWIVPQVNPDGGDKNERRNDAGIDLNRDHVVKEAPETRYLHDLFWDIRPHVTADIHEYFPYRESWEEFGGYKNFDVQVGAPTNINIDEDIRDFALNEVMPHIEKRLNAKGYSFHNYIVGPVPTEGRTRHSTVDFDDGRQGFGILNTLSFIYEGINGTDGYVENLERRADSQYEALLALIDYLNDNYKRTIELVQEGRQNLVNAEAGEKIAVRLEHFPDGSKLELPLKSSKTGKDTLIIIENYHPKVKATLEVKRPKAYLVPKNDSLLAGFLELHNIKYKSEYDLDNKSVKAYRINRIALSEDEELENRRPEVSLTDYTGNEITENFYFIPVNQLHANFLVSVFEPESMLGLAQRPGYKDIIQEGEVYPVLRVERKY